MGHGRWSGCLEAMVLSTIAGKIEDEEEEEEEEVLDPVEEGDMCGGCDEGDEDGPFGGWARRLGAHAGAARCGESSCEDGCATHASTPSIAVGAVLAVAGGASDVKKSDGSRLPTSGTAQERKEQHFKMASEQGHAAFACGCPIARARGATSCLDRFGKEQFRRWHNETYGVTADGSDAKHLDPASSIHSRMWSLKEPLAGPGEKGLDEYGRKWQIKTWKLDVGGLYHNETAQEWGAGSGTSLCSSVSKPRGRTHGVALPGRAAMAHATLWV